MTKEECFEKVKERLACAIANQDKDYGFYRGIEMGIRESLEIFGMLDKPNTSSKVKF